MELETFDLVLRAATAALALAAAAAIIARPERNRIAGYAAFAVAGIAAFVIASAPGAHRALGLGAFFFNAWCLATPAVLWLLSRALFYDRPQSSPAELAAIGALVALTMAGDYGRFRLGPLAAYPDAAQALLLAGRGVAALLLLTACAMAVMHWRVDLVEERRRARAIFVGVVAASFVVLASSEFVFGGGGAPLEALVFGHVLLLALALAILLAVAHGRFDALLAQSAPRPLAGAPLAVVRSDGADAVLARKVVEEMAARKLWKRDGLGIADLAAELGTQEHRLRRAINHHLGYRNFNEFLHDYRLREAAARLRDPAENRLPVLSIALDCGYGSIGPFNRAFKARFGVTPTQYRELVPQTVAVSEIGQHSR